MAKRCWGITKNFKRCTGDRMLIPVCTKHVWQFIQLLVFVLTTGAILITLELHHIYEAHIHEMQQEKKIENEMANEVKDDQKSSNKYQKWGE
ncbi:MAG: hypothetical protein ACUZ8E_00545 [Candidatus Anammoxibacter sp.]